MGCLTAAVRALGVVVLTWLVLVVLVLLPGLLPAGWQYYIYSPASVGLWMLSMVVAPFLACFALWGWIRDGRRASSR
ncbi:hypothetical protein [Streptomyces sp. Tue6028]|uniref:hypothetical protein n=1 Tax=Streptomyces sp. Tue6028 TaxID=2036037 RepID=UPI003D74F778